jgi:hypothetical protein
VKLGTTDKHSGASGTSLSGKKAASVQDNHGSNKKGVAASEAVLQDSELAQRKALESKIAEQASDKRFNGEMAQSASEKILRLMNKKR